MPNNPLQIFFQLLESLNGCLTHPLSLHLQTSTVMLLESRRAGIWCFSEISNNRGVSSCQTWAGRWFCAGGAAVRCPSRLHCIPLLSSLPGGCRQRRAEPGEGANEAGCRQQALGTAGFGDSVLWGSVLVWQRCWQGDAAEGGERKQRAIVQLWLTGSFQT